MILKLTLLERLLRRLHLLPAPIMDAFGGVLFGRALTIAVRRGFFEALAGAPRPVEYIAAATKLRHEPVRLLAQALVVAGYCTRSGDDYALSAEGRKWLLQSSPHYLGNLVRYFERLFDRWTYLEYALEHGRPERPYYELFAAEDWEIYVLGMRDLARLLLSEVMPKIHLAGDPQQLLDIGGSHGLYAIEACRRYPTLSATVVDFAPALKQTSRLLAEAGMQQRVSLFAGNFTKMDLPPAQDCVLLFNIVHGLTQGENADLCQRAIGSLRAGGKLYLLDQLKQDSRKSGLSQFIPLMVGLNLLNEIGGTAYSFDQVKSWCKGASVVKRLRLRLPGVTLVEAVKERQ